MELLNGNFAPVIKDLEEKMKAASEALEFEKAMEYRDLLTSVRQVAQKQKITSFDGEDRDILALAMDDRDAVVQVFFVREGKLIGREHFHVTVGAEIRKKRFFPLLSVNTMRERLLFLRRSCCRWKLMMQMW